MIQLFVQCTSHVVIQGWLTPIDSIVVTFPLKLICTMIYMYLYIGVVVGGH